TRTVDVTLVAALLLLIGMLLVALSPHTSVVSRWVIGWIPWRRLREKLTVTIEKVLVSMRTLRELGGLRVVMLLGLTLFRVLIAVVMLMCFAMGIGMAVGI